VNSVNKLGGFLISADRLAIIDGEYDPWRPATPHSPYAPPRKNTILRPFIQLSKAVHHWDEVCQLKSTCVFSPSLGYIFIEWAAKHISRTCADSEYPC
jgi:hypothetical protein